MVQLSFIQASAWVLRVVSVHIQVWLAMEQSDSSMADTRHFSCRLEGNMSVHMSKSWAKQNGL